MREIIRKTLHVKPYDFDLLIDNSEINIILKNN